jgi:hypothetical protein
MKNERGKWLRLEAREMEQRKREHALGCQVCYDMLDSESCDAYQHALAKDGRARALQAERRRRIIVG